jgi:two-component system NtrC family sensor kinase
MLFYLMTFSAHILGWPWFVSVALPNPALLSVVPLKVVCLIMIALGACIIGSSSVKTRQIIKLLGASNSLWQWKVLYGLKLSFLGGYALAFALLLYEDVQWLGVLTSVVFFLGAVFVLLSVSVFYQTLETLMFTQAQYASEQARAEEALERLYHLKQNQMERIHHEKMLGIQQLAAGITHEFNNSINFIHGNIEHLEAHIADVLKVVNYYEQTPSHSQGLDGIDLAFIKVDILNIIRSIRHGSVRTQTLVAALKDFSRLDESGQKVVSLHQGLESTLALVRSQLQADGSRKSAIEVVCDYGEIPPISCEPAAINQVFMHLVTNAIDALRTDSFIAGHDSEQPKRITLRTQVAQEGWVSIQVADTGCGMTPVTQALMFDPFFTTKPVGHGTGLGLAISYQIVRRHGGFIRCRSAVGLGTTITVNLPVSRSAGAGRVSPRRGFNAEGEPTPPSHVSLSTPTPEHVTTPPSFF